MTRKVTESMAQRLRAALAAPSASDRMQTAMAAGLRPEPGFVDVLVERCAVEPDFFVRDMLTWALLQQDRPLTLRRVLPELRSPVPQARSQALHTLSKLGDPSSWPALTDDLLHDADDEVARTAWRAAAVLVPAEGAEVLAEALATQWGRGDRTTQRALSAALVALGDASAAVIERAKQHRDEGIRTHATATARLRDNPDEAFDSAIAAAQRVAALRGAPLVGDLGV